MADVRPAPARRHRYRRCYRWVHMKHPQRQRGQHPLYCQRHHQRSLRLRRCALPLHSLHCRGAPVSPPLRLPVGGGRETGRPPRTPPGGTPQAAQARRHCLARLERPARRLRPPGKRQPRRRGSPWPLPLTQPTAAGRRFGAWAASAAVPAADARPLPSAKCHLRLICPGCRQPSSHREGPCGRGLIAQQLCPRGHP